MFVLYVKTKGKSQDNQDKAERIKYRKRTKISRWGEGGKRFSAPVQNGPGAHPASFPGVERPGVALTTHLHLVSRLKKE